MKVRVFVIACLLVFSVSVVADEVALSNAKALFPAEKIKNRMIFYPMFAARLNPSGTHFIYSKMVPATPPDYKTKHKMMVYDIKAGKEKPIEVPLANGYETISRLMDMFSMDGEKLAMVQDSGTNNRKENEVVIYDLKRNTVVSTGVKGDSYWPIFDSAGENIFLFDVIDDNAIAKKVELTGFKSIEINITGFVHTPSPYSSYASVCVPSPTPERQADLQIWNLKGEKKIADLPVHKNNSMLGGFRGNWLADDKYFAYLDVGKKAGQKKPGAVVRIWDVEKNKQAAELFDAMAAGPGPGKTTLVAASVDWQGKHDGMFVYDVKNKKYMDIGPKGAKVIHACGNKLLYMLKENGEDMVYVADVTMLESQGVTKGPDI